MKIGIFGDGVMGQQVYSLAEQNHIEVTFIYDVADATGVDVAIDFSHPDFFDVVKSTVMQHTLPVVICTTGLNEGQMQEIDEMSKHVPVIYTRNTSLGVTVLTHLAEEATRLLQGYDIEVIEKHHNQKVDAPSGTALQIVQAIEGAQTDMTRVYGREGLVGKRADNEIGIHAIRGGSIVGEHSIIFAGNDEVIELKHEAFSKKLFASGAIKAAQYIYQRQPGHYTMNDVLGISSQRR